MNAQCLVQVRWPQRACCHDLRIVLRYAIPPLISVIAVVTVSISAEHHEGSLIRCSGTENAPGVRCETPVRSRRPANRGEPTEAACTKMNQDSLCLVVTVGDT